MYKASRACMPHEGDPHDMNRAFRACMRHRGARTA
jgi:hypothetical protein